MFFQNGTLLIADQTKIASWTLAAAARAQIIDATGRPDHNI
jgi:hypothetical protein